MEGFSRRYLGYLRASLADGARLAPNLDEGVEADTISLMNGRVGPDAIQRLFKRAREQAPQWMEDEQLWPLKVLVCPYVYMLRPEHGRPSRQLPARVILLVLSGKLRKDGALDADESCLLPLIPREYLEPSFCGVVVGSIDDADQTYANLDTRVQSWSALRERAQELIQKVTGQHPDELVLKRYEKNPNGFCVLQKVGGATVHIERLLDVMLKDTERDFPLLEALLTSAPDLPVKSARESLAASALHLGQMECRYALSKSQREALAHHLARPEESPHVLAIDGPPGTGKTTLLLSVIATAWVQRALDEAEPPLIMATSTNNQAVDNILEACAKIKEPAHALSGRWLTGIRSYGQLLPAKSRADSGKIQQFHTVLDSTGGLRHDAQNFESRDGLRIAQTQYLEHFRTAFPESQVTEVEQAKHLLHRELKEVVDSIRAAVDALLAVGNFVDLAAISNVTCEARAAQFQSQIGECSTRVKLTQDRVRQGRQLRKDWKAHLSTEPLWRTLLAAIGLKGPRSRRDELFCAGAEIEFADLVADRLRDAHERADIERLVAAVLGALESETRSAAETLGGAEREMQPFSQAHDALKKRFGDKCDGSVEAIQEQLDLELRYRAFKLATHYWEARYLLEVEQQLLPTGTLGDSKSPVKLERFYRRLAKLFPYSVSTAYTLPRRFTGWTGEDKPLFGAIDLLIVDEAGQILPDTGVLSFALAKQALVVGDVDQLRPIWQIPRPLDAQNALRFGVITSIDDLDTFHEQALAVSGSSLMRIAQRATPFSQYPQRGRGMLLREHRRCWPEIIEICNTLVYERLLICKRDEEPRKFVPSVGYVHIPGIDRHRGTSRYNLAEAAAVAKWLGHQKTAIESAFQKEKKALAQLVAVVTPFVAQTQAIRAALSDEFGSQHGFTVGTVDALQGAEYRVVIFSPTYGVGTTPGTTRFDRNPSFLNVAVSRAQDAFLIFGNMHLFKPQGTHPSASVGKHLFIGGQNELKDVPPALLVPGQDFPPGSLIHDLHSHRAVLAEAFETARFRLVIVSPFLASAAIEEDEIPLKILRATKRGVSVKIVSEALLNSGKPWQREQFEQSKHTLIQAGADVRAADGPSVHSKLILVDSSWLVVGSFNWLSSPRDPANPYIRLETSIRYDGNEAFEMIRESLKDLATIVPRQGPSNGAVSG